MNAPYYNGDDNRDSLSPHDPDAVAHGHGECECHCDRCGAALSLDPIYGTWYARCGDCYGGAEPDGEAFRGGEAAAFEAEQHARIQRTLK